MQAPETHLTEATETKAGEIETTELEAVDTEGTNVEVAELCGPDILNRYIYATGEVTERIFRGEVQSRKQHIAAALGAIAEFEVSSGKKV